MVRSDKISRSLSLSGAFLFALFLCGAKGDGCGGEVAIGSNTGGGEGGSSGDGGDSASGNVGAGGMGGWGNAGAGGDGSSANAGAGGMGGWGTGMGSTSNTGAGGEGGAQGIACPFLFPTFDKACATAADCVMKLHTIDCCGTNIAIGVNVSESVAFDQAEAICDTTYQACFCPPAPTKTDDGKTTSDESIIQIACLSGSCSTLIP